MKTRTNLGMLAMFATFFITFASIGMPHNIWGALIYAVLMIWSSFVAQNIATEKGQAYTGSGGVGLFFIYLSALFSAFCIIFLGGLFLGGNYTASTLFGVATISVATYFICKNLEPTEECLAQIKSIQDFQEKVRLKTEDAVMGLIQEYPELDPKNFGIRECFSLTALFTIWSCIYGTVESVVRDMGSSNQKRMEIKPNYELWVIHKNGSHMIDPQTVISEVRYFLTSGSHIYKPDIIYNEDKVCTEDDCKKILNWLRRAIYLKKELGLFGSRGSIDYFRLWRAEVPAMLKTNLDKI